MDSSLKDPNLLEQFEKAYAELLSVLSSPSTSSQCSTSSATHPIQSSLQEDSDLDNEKLAHFLQVARKMETFFLQKRMKIHVMKPELILKEDALQELKQELGRKDELLKKHKEKLKKWQAMLEDNQPVNPHTNQPPNQGKVAGAPGAQQQAPQPLYQQRLNNPNMQIPQGTGNMMAPGRGIHQGGFIPGNNYRMMQPNPMPRQPNLQMNDPLSYLERTTSNAGGIR